ncbi:MAG: 3-phosphoshikimate 1-carboxyvinyltransferase [Selenomonadaceae bacterium]|nr:3-phosphoshikimate 1-carboxyvinyltransferase [Selenomonadaceae bacterium]
MNKIVNKVKNGLMGELNFPGDKSVSHRSVMLSALGASPVRIVNFLNAEDTLSTAKIMGQLGAKIEFVGDTELIVTGNGLHGLNAPTAILDAGNSGTTLRLLMGLLSGANIAAEFTGDASLSKRPMKRIITPLSTMGANIESTDGKLPIRIKKSEGLKGVTYEMPMASAQLKSALLLAGLFANGKTTVIEPAVSRDHTERMLAAFGASILRGENSVTIEPAKELIAPENILVPSDISSAAYFMVAALIIPNSDVILKDIGVNPTRTGIIDVLKKMGGNIELNNKRTVCGEEIADIRVRSSKLSGVTFGKEIMGRLIDEIPIIAVAAAFADGKTVVKDAGELRVKETDRIKAIATSFNKLAKGMIEETENGFVVTGKLPINFAAADSFNDHRIAMSLAILGAAAKGVEIENSESVNISYPGFYDTLEKF